MTREELISSLQTFAAENDTTLTEAEAKETLNAMLKKAKKKYGVFQFTEEQREYYDSWDIIEECSHARMWNSKKEYNEVIGHIDKHMAEYGNKDGLVKLRKEIEQKLATLENS